MGKCIYVKEWPNDLNPNHHRDVAVCYKPLTDPVGSTDSISHFIWKFLDLFGNDDFKIAIFPDIKEAKKILKIMNCYYKGKMWQCELSGSKIHIDFIDYEDMAVILAEKKLEQT